MAPGRGQLEVLQPADGDGYRSAPAPGAEPPSVGGVPRPPRSPSPRWRRWLAVAVVVALVAFGVGVAAKHWLARRQVAWLDRQWLAANEDDLGRFTSEYQLQAYVSVGEGPAVAAALAAVYRQERADLETLTGRLRRAVLVDHGLSRLRGQMMAVLADRATLLARWAAAYSSETKGFVPVDTSGQFESLQVLDQQVQERLSAEQTHLGVVSSRSPAPPVYSSATAALARLRPWLDQPTGTVLLAGSASDGVLERLDVDHSRATPLVVLADGPVVPRQGYLAYTSSAGLWAVAPDGTGTPRLLAPVNNYFFAAADPRYLWVTSNGATQVSEIDGTGRVVAGPVTPPQPAEGATAKGLVLALQDGSGIETWDPASARVTCRRGGEGWAGVVAAAGDVVVWIGAASDVVVTNVASCTDLFRQPVDDTTVSPQAAFSPDGTTVALSWDPPRAGGGGPVLIDVDSGAETPVPAVATLGQSTVGAVLGTAWSADGHRLFWLQPAPGNPSLIFTWRVGDPASQVLRAVDVRLTGPLYTVGVP